MVAEILIRLICNKNKVNNKRYNKIIKNGNREILYSLCQKLCKLLMRLGMEIKLGLLIKYKVIYCH